MSKLFSGPNPLAYINQGVEGGGAAISPMGKARAKHPDAPTSLTDLMMTHMDHGRWKEVKQLAAHNHRFSHQPIRNCV